MRQNVIPLNWGTDRKSNPCPIFWHFYKVFEQLSRAKVSSISKTSQVGYKSHEEIIFNICGYIAYIIQCKEGEMIKPQKHIFVFSSAWFFFFFYTNIRNLCDHYRDYFAIFTIAWDSCDSKSRIIKANSHQQMKTTMIKSL